MSHSGTHTEHADYTARGMAAESIQALRSHDALNTLQFQNMDDKHEEIKKLIAETNKKIDAVVTSYDNKFWSLAVSIIFLLVSGLAAVLFKLIVK